MVYLVFIEEQVIYFYWQEAYGRWLEGEDVSKTKDELDPFWEPTEDVLIGKFADQSMQF